MKRLVGPMWLVVLGVFGVSVSTSAGQHNSWWLILDFAGGLACGISVSWAYGSGRQAQLDDDLIAHAVLEQRRQNARWS